MLSRLRRIVAVPFPVLIQPKDAPECIPGCFAVLMQPIAQIQIAQRGRVVRLVLQLFDAITSTTPFSSIKLASENASLGSYNIPEIEFAPVPEPATLTLLLTALFGLASLALTRKWLTPVTHVVARAQAVSVQRVRKTDTKIASVFPVLAG